MRYSIIFLSLIILGCKKENTPNFHYDYYPISEGHFVTYSVREIIIDDVLFQDDTLNYFIKTVIGDTISDNEGRIARRFERYFRDSVNHPWILQDSWTTIIADGRAELVEENQRTIKLVFSPSKYKEWNCNAYSTLDALDCYYRDIHKPASINGFSFDSTITVEQEDFDDKKLFYRRKYEQYAKGVGMYYKQETDFNFQLNTTNVIKGKEIIMRLIDYGEQ